MSDRPAPAPLAEVWRGEFLESIHTGHAVICDAEGQVIESWGDPDAVILPRSSAKMIQALPLLTSGAADAAGLTTAQLALACASHNGAAIHINQVKAWLEDLDLSDDDLRCGPQVPGDIKARHDLIRRDLSPRQVHNNCSGKHVGFLTLTRHLGAGPDYVAPDHKVQVACREVFEEVTGETSPGFGIDGCSAPNFATTLSGLGRAMAFFATAANRGGVIDRSAVRLVDAMVKHPDLVAGEGRACTELMRAMPGRVALKTGAEGVYVAIVPEKQLGIALKVSDGATRASECAIAALLVRIGVLDASHPATLARMNATLRNRRGTRVGVLRAPETLLAQ